MSLVFAAVCPHPPMLIPDIGKDSIVKIEKTKLAFEELEKKMYVTKPDVIFIISPHGHLFNQAFTINSNPEFESNFKHFGDFTTEKKWQGASEIASTIKLEADKNDIPVGQIGHKKLDHGASVPLFYMTEHSPNLKILPIGYSGLDPKTHLEFGILLKDIISQTDLRVAIIASGDLSHALTSDAPAGFSKVGKEFDEKIIELLETKNTAGFATLDEEFVKEAHECAYRSLLILLGALKQVNYNFKNLSYEAPFGVGYLTGSFDF